ncbi:PAS domain S-box-containing protein [Rhodovulum bhavnagarense]|uniref:histidine kinase n=1 Tax=Rhodovulum bhavnagarense TaxID=992286 RepID=A0A4R2R904_9RHOB|nr:PAS domain S-box protein [Rhodovulum bhavnagarense]TCP58417.1 PAS domain S-box-containing protein [Rhodovulum bhavnagarense]
MTQSRDIGIETPARRGNPAFPADLTSEEAYRRLTDAQFSITRVFDNLLRAAPEHADDAIDQALADIGAFFASDRSYLFQVRGGTVMDNTFEWCGEGIEPMIGVLQDLPIELAARWFESFDRGEAVHIPDVPAMPDDAAEKETLMMQGIKSLVALPLELNGKVTGFVGLDSVRNFREFLPGEISLLRSAANAIQALIDRREAARRVETAHQIMQTERNRLRATLDAIPDLVLELDQDGRFVNYHTGDQSLVVLPPEQVIGRTIDEALPPETARLANALLQATVEKGIARHDDLPLETPAGRLYLSAVAARSPADPATARSSYIAVVRNTTDERARKQRLERLSRIVEDMSDVVIVSDVTGRITYVNPAFEAQTGHQLQEVLGQYPGELLRGRETDPHDAARVEAAIAAREPATVEILNYRKDGTPFWTEMRLQPLTDAEGRHEGYMSVQTDITERKTYQEVLDQRTQEMVTAQQRLSGAISALPDAFAYYDAEDRLVVCNERYRQCYPKSAPLMQPGRTFEEILRYGVARGEYAEAIGQEEDWIARRLAAHRMEEHHGEQLLDSGRWLRIIEKRTPDGGQVGLRIDITDLKRSVQRAEKERLAAMDATRDGIGVADAQGRLIYMNPALATMFGLSNEDERLGQSWKTFYPPTTADFIETSVMEAIEKAGSWQGELTAQRKDGSLFPLEVSHTRREDGGIMCVARDITDRKKSLQEQARLREQLQVAQRREILSQFSRGIAHDFNNLLAAISGSAMLLRDGIAVEANAERIIAASQSGASLVSQFFELSGKPLPRAEIDLRTPLRDACNLLEVSLGHEVTLNIDLPDRPMIADANTTDVLQVVLNLGLNARDAILTSGLARAHRIEVALSSAGPEMTRLEPLIGRLVEDQAYHAIRVSDTGIGIAPEMQSRILEPAFTTKPDSGTGLGLTIISSVLRSYRGALVLETEPGEGSSFTVLWPVEGTGATRHPLPVRSVATITGRLDGRKILAVDDNADVLGVVANYLELAGAEVAACTDPRDALEALEDDPDFWDLIVTDYDMPGMTGADLARAAREKAPTLPVVLVTAVPDWHERCNNDTGAVFAAVMGKPISQADLIRAAEHALVGRGDMT